MTDPSFVLIISSKKSVHPLNAWTCAPKGHKPIAQGIALGAYWVFTCALLRAKA